jgi:hypothetical protein
VSGKFTYQMLTDEIQIHLRNPKGLQPSFLVGSSRRKSIVIYKLIIIAVSSFSCCCCCCCSSLIPSLHTCVWLESNSLLLSDALAYLVFWSCLGCLESQLKFARSRWVTANGYASGSGSSTSESSRRLGALQLQIIDSSNSRRLTDSVLLASAAHAQLI